MSARAQLLFDKLKSKSQQMMLLTGSLMGDSFGFFIFPKQMGLKENLINF